MASQHASTRPGQQWDTSAWQTPGGSWRELIKVGKRQPASAIGAWLLSALTDDLDERRRQLAAIQARIEAQQFFPAEFIVIRVVYEALVQKHLPADADPGAVNAVARDAARVVARDFVRLFGWASPDLIATAAVIRRAMGDKPQPRYLGFEYNIFLIWISVSHALVTSRKVRPSEIRRLIHVAERTAAEWTPQSH
jgi:hypothetical protein